MPSGLALSPVDATMLGLWPRFEAEGVLLREAPALRGDDGVLARLLRSPLKERSKSSVEGLRPHDFHRDARPTQPPVEAESLFHQHWWLDAVAGSQWQEVTVADNGTVVRRDQNLWDARAGNAAFHQDAGPLDCSPAWKNSDAKTTDHEDHLGAD